MTLLYCTLRARSYLELKRTLLQHALANHFESRRSGGLNPRSEARDSAVGSLFANISARRRSTAGRASATKVPASAAALEAAAAAKSATAAPPPPPAGSAPGAAAAAPAAAGKQEEPTALGSALMTGLSLFGFSAAAPAAPTPAIAAAAGTGALAVAGHRVKIDAAAQARMDIPRRDRARRLAELEAEAKQATVKTKVVVGPRSDGTYDVSWPPLTVASVPLGFQLREANRRWRAPRVARMDRKGSLRAQPVEGHLLLKVNGVDVDRLSTDTEAKAAVSASAAAKAKAAVLQAAAVKVSDPLAGHGDDDDDDEALQAVAAAEVAATAPGALTGAARKDNTAFDRAVRLLRESWARRDQQLTLTFGPAEFGEMAGFIEDSDEVPDEEEGAEATAAAFGADDESSDGEEDSGVEGRGGGGEELSPTARAARRRQRKEDAAAEEAAAWEETISVRDFRDSMPPGHFDGNDEKEFFRRGDKVGWRREDADIPRGTVGTVVGFLESGHVRVLFDGVGTFSLPPPELKEPIWEDEGGDDIWAGEEHAGGSSVERGGVAGAASLFGPPEEVEGLSLRHVELCGGDLLGLPEERAKRLGLLAGGGDVYSVLFRGPDLKMKLMENVDCAKQPVVSKAFPGAKLMKRGHVLLAINGAGLMAGDDPLRQAAATAAAGPTAASEDAHRPFSAALDALTLLDPAAPALLTFARPAPLCKVRAVEGDASLYDAVFERGGGAGDLGIDLGSFGDRGTVVRVVATHPVGIPHVGDQVVAVNGVGILASDAAKRGAAAHDPLAFVQRALAEGGQGGSAAEVVIRFKHNHDEMAEGEAPSEARGAYSVLFLSSHLGLGFKLTSGVPLVTSTRPVFTRPAVGDLLTAVNGAEISRCGVPVCQLVLMLQALPRPLRLSFVGRSDSLLAALQGGNRRVDVGSIAYPEHHLRQVLVPRGPTIGLKLITVSSRPVVQEVTSQELWDQGVRPMDVLVSVRGHSLGEATAAEAAAVLRKAKWDTVHAAFKVGLLRMGVRDDESSFFTQHPVDVASALTEYDPETRVGILSFSVPYAIPEDKYRVEVFRYGSQVAPALAHSVAAANDQYLRVTSDGRARVLSYAEIAALEVLDEDAHAREARLQREQVGKAVEEMRNEMLALKYEAKMRQASEAAPKSKQHPGGGKGGMGVPGKGVGMEPAAWDKAAMLGGSDSDVGSSDSDLGVDSDGEGGDI